MIKEIINLPLRFSRFLHILKEKEYIALFHSLTIETVFLSARALELVSEFKTGKNISYIIMQKELDFSEKKSFFSLVERLIEFKMLVPLSCNEGKELNGYQKNYLRNPVINMAYLVLTDACNLRCRYCFVRQDIDTKYNFSFMSSGVVRQSLNFFAKWTSESVSKNKTVILYGGEPLLNKEAFCLAIKHMHILKKKKLLPEDLEISVITNGTLIDRNIASFMKDYNVLVGISVDGMPKVNDEYRCFPGGNGSFKKTRTGCETLKSVGVEFSLSITITPSSVKNLLKHVQWLIEKFEPKGIGLNLLMDSAERIISSSEYAEIATKEMIRCFEFLRENGIHENRMMRKIDSFVDKKIYPYDCGGCGRQVVFLPSGEVGMCQAYILSKKFFSIPDSKFSPYTNNDFIGWAKRSPLTMPQCLDCIVLGICGGGCPARADFRHGSILALDDIFCIHAKETLKWMINDLYRYESEEG